MVKKSDELRLLKGIFPIKSKIIISERGKIEIDNPRTEEEINYVLNKILSVIDPEENFCMDIENHCGYDSNYGDIIMRLPLKDILKLSDKIIEHHKDNSFFDNNFVAMVNSVKSEFQIDDSYLSLIKSYHKANKSKDEQEHNERSILYAKIMEEDNKHAKKVENFLKNEALRFIAKNWLIVRFEKPDSLYILSILEILLPDLMRKINEVNNTYLGDLSFSELTVDKTIIYNAERFFTYPLSEDIRFILDKTDNYFVRVRANDDFSFVHTLANFLPRINDIAVKINRLTIDQFFKICFMGELLEHIIKNDFSESLGLVSLVGILDGLLTHNPDPKRFHIEDSITKQFCLKGAIILHKENIGQDLASISAQLKILYNARSSIVHGNVKELIKIKSKESIKELNQKAIHYVSIILQSYIDDPIFIESLKDL